MAIPRGETYPQNITKYSTCDVPSNCNNPLKSRITIKGGTPDTTGTLYIDVNGNGKKSEIIYKTENNTTSIVAKTLHDCMGCECDHEPSSFQTLFSGIDAKSSIEFYAIGDINNDGKFDISFKIDGKIQTVTPAQVSANTFVDGRL